MTEPYYEDDLVRLFAGDCAEVMAGMADNSVDAVVTDPPYSLRFMGRSWDDHATPQQFQAWCQLWAAECLRVLKPGGHLLAFGGTRTHHRLTCAIEDAGFEIRDTITWIYGSGFPKSLDVSKAIDKAAGAEREIIGQHPMPAGNKPGGASLKMSVLGMPDTADITAPATDAARQWQGFGTALKPSSEPVVCARKPLSGTVAANVQQWGTGALNIDGCRVATDGPTSRPPLSTNKHAGYQRPWNDDPVARAGVEARREIAHDKRDDLGRWPPNVVLDGHAAAELDRQSGVLTTGSHLTHHVYRASDNTSMSGANYERSPRSDSPSNEGGASRFFPTFRYEAKAPASERPKGDDGTGHPTVKPLDLMRWLVRLVVPPGGLCLDPFAGSGTTGEACVIEGFRCLLVENDPESLTRIVNRLSKPIQPDLFGGVG